MLVDVIECQATLRRGFNQPENRNLVVSASSASTSGREFQTRLECGVSAQPLRTVLHGGMKQLVAKVWYMASG